MALVTIPVGINILFWTGPTTTLTGASWFTSNNLNGVFKPSAIRLGFISSKPGAAFPGFTQVTAPVSGQVPSGYIFNVKTAFQLDNALVGVVASAGNQLATPTNVQAVSNGATSITVVCASVAFASGYQFYRAATAQSSFSPVGGVVTTPSYTDTGLAPTTRYYYVVVAKGNGTTYVDSQFSAQVNALTDSSQLATPTGYSATPLGGGISQTLSAVPNATAYVFDIATNSAFTAGLQSITQTSTTTNWTNLPASTLYYTRAKAQAGGYMDSGYATAQVTTAAAGAVPPAPAVTANAIARTVTVTMAAGTVPTDYEIEFSDSSPAPDGPAVTANAVARTLTLTLAPGTTAADYEIQSL